MKAPHDLPREPMMPSAANGGLHRADLRPGTGCAFADNSAAYGQEKTTGRFPNP